MPYQFSPSVVPKPDFSAIEDALSLRLCIRNLKDEYKKFYWMKIIDILTTRTHSQRQEISNEYHVEFNRILIDDLKTVLAGDFEVVIVALMTPLTDYLCKELNAAMVGWGTDEETLIEILCPRTKNEITAIVDRYKQMYHRSLLEDIQSDCSGIFLELLKLIVSGSRTDEGATDPEKAHQEAQKLSENLNVWTTFKNPDTYMRVLTQNSFAQLRLIFEEYSKTGHFVSSDIDRSFRGEFRIGLRAIVDCVQNSSKWFATQVYKTMAGIGTDENSLTRILVTRSEIDLKNIMKEYQTLYGCTLKSDIMGDTSGDYLEVLVALLGPATKS